MEGTAAQRTFAPESSVVKTQSRERSKITIPSLDSVPSISKGKACSPPFSFCFTIFILGVGAVVNNGL